MDTGLALLTQSHLPLPYWADAFNAAIYLINRLPKNVLKHHSPYFKLLHKQPDYSFLKIFGCACYPLLKPYYSHKLMYPSNKCNFLGYCSNYIGYKCYDPTSEKTIINYVPIIHASPLLNVNTLASLIHSASIESITKVVSSLHPSSSISISASFVAPSSPILHHHLQPLQSLQQM